MLILPLVGCNKMVAPTKLTTSSSEVKVIVNSERDLNDIVTLRFEPRNTSNKKVTWSSEVNDIFTLTGSTIKANKIGTAMVTATSVANENLKTDVAIRVYNPNSVAHTVSINQDSGFSVTGLQNEYKEGDEVTFTVQVTDSTKEIAKVEANDDVLEPINGTSYRFVMPDSDVTIKVTMKTVETLKVATSVTLSPASLFLNVGDGDKKITANVKPIDTTDVPTWSISEGQEFVTITPTANEVMVHAVKEGIAKIKVAYNENVYAECLVTIDSSLNIQTRAKYNVEYDLGTRKTAKLIETTDELFNVFKLDGENSGIINSISEMNYIYGGGNGGRSETAWFSGNMLKFGTTSVNGNMTFALSAYVNRVIITGYVSDNSSKIQIGDSSSTDWTEETNDNKTTLVTCSDMVEASKEVVEGNQVTTITIDFESTMNLKIATTNKKPIYITSIEFIAYANIVQ